MSLSELRWSCLWTPCFKISPARWQLIVRCLCVSDFFFSSQPLTDGAEQPRFVSSVKPQDKATVSTSLTFSFLVLGFSISAKSGDRSSKLSSRSSSRETEKNSHPKPGYKSTVGYPAVYVTNKLESERLVCYAAVLQSFSEWKLIQTACAMFPQANFSP